MTDLVWHTDVAVEFISRFHGAGFATVTAIRCDETTTGGDSVTVNALLPQQVSNLTNFIERSQNNHNIYFMLARPRDGLGHKKAKKEEVQSTCWLHVDIDPRPRDDDDIPLEEHFEQERARAIARLAAYKHQPTVILDSGGGIQAFWKLKEPFGFNGTQESYNVIEDRNRALALAVGADMACWNMDRIMRVPGTINIPDARKVKKGRTRRAASLIEFNENVYDLDQFECQAAAISGPTAAAPGSAAVANVVQLREIPQHVDLDAIPQLTEELKEVAVAGLSGRFTKRWSSRSEMYFWWIVQCRQLQISQEVVVSILLDDRFGISRGVVEKRDQRKYAMRQIYRAEQKAGISSKPIIQCSPDNLPRQIDAIENIIMDGGLEIYQMEDRVVRIVEATYNTAPYVVDVKTKWLLEKFIDHALWMKHNGKELKKFEPKVNVAEHYLDRQGEWKLPRVTGIVHTPTLRADLTLLDSPGYDQESGLLYIGGTDSYPKIPDAPTRDDAVAALDKLIRPFRAFPFVPDRDRDDWTPTAEEGLKASSARSVVLSAMITGVIRASLPTAPMHATDAPEKGSGKSLIADCVSMLLTGRPAAPVSLGNDETEDEKRLVSVLMAGARMVVIDNVERAVEGAALCTILTQPTWQGRILGKSQMPTLPTNALFMATGNNITFKGDMTRRVLICRIDARSEHPDQRRFSFDPRQEVKAARLDLVMAALTVLRGWVAAGKPVPEDFRPMGSFEAWDMVRCALIWLGQPDPALTRTLTQAEDPAKTAIAEISEMWLNCFRTEEQRLITVFSDLCIPGISDHHKSELRDLLTSVCPNSKLSLRGLQNWFRKNSSKIVGGRRFVRSEDRRRGTMIKLETAEVLSDEEEIKM